MPQMNVSKSVVINKPIHEVFTLINDFSHWEKWSPWQILEKNVQNKITDNNKFYEWVGDVTGSGNMRITKEIENQSVFIDLLFLKPFKSKAKVDFQLSQEGDGTKVIWNMQSSLPFFLFFMVKAMTVFIGMDFDRGLLLLKDVAEDGVAHCKLDFNPNGKIQGGKYIGIHRKIATDNLPEIMANDFTKLMEFARAKDGLINGNPLTIYNAYNPVKQQADFISSVMVSEVPNDLPSDFVSGTINAANTFVVKTTGPYHHIGNAWSSAEIHARGKKFKKNKKSPAYEVYLNSPMDTAPNDLAAEIHLVKK